MGLIRKITNAGAVREIEVTYSWKGLDKDMRRPRGHNQHVSTEEQQRRNLWNAKRLLSRLINANFTRRDVFFTLTHAEHVTEAEAKRALDKFLRDMRKFLRLLHMPELKYIVVTENKHKEDHRIHHHMIMNQVDYTAVRGMWNKGNVIFSELFGKDFTGLAHYMSKDPVDPHKRRWRQSKQLVHPEPEIRLAGKEDRTATAPIRTPKGYHMVYSRVEWFEDMGVWKYAKFLLDGEVDLSTGKCEVLEE